MRIKHFFLGLIAITCLVSGLLYWQYSARHVETKPVSFSALPGWSTADTRLSLKAFQRSCQRFLHQNPEHRVGSRHFKMRAKDWIPACRAAVSLPTTSKKTSRAFFEKWFTPMAFYKGRPLQGLFTGYYLPEVSGSLTKTDDYPVPLYGLPKDLVTVDLNKFNRAANRPLVGRVVNQQLLPYYTREAIQKGAIEKTAPIIAWLKNTVDRLFLEIQGSGVVALPDNQTMDVGYAGENGASYFPVGRALIERGIMTTKNASMQKIRAYLEAHPFEADSIILQNPSFVFFRQLNRSAALGSQGVTLTPGYSLAIDRAWIPMGAPVWLDTTRPSLKHHQAVNFQRLMVAQDTGGAIRGAVRGDVFWGHGDNATYIAGQMKNHGFYWLLLPRKEALP